MMAITDDPTGAIDLDDEEGAALVVEAGDEHDGRRLDQVLAALVEGHSRSQLQRLVREGRVLVDGQAVTRPSAPVEAGAVLHVVVPAPAAARPVAQDLPLPILYEDDDLVVVDKPAGMVVHPGAGHSDGTLVNALLHLRLFAAHGAVDQLFLAQRRRLLAQPSHGLEIARLSVEQVEHRNGERDVCLVHAALGKHTDSRRVLHLHPVAIIDALQAASIVRSAGTIDRIGLLPARLAGLLTQQPVV